MSYRSDDYLEGYSNGLEDAMRSTNGIEKVSFWLGLALGSVAVTLTIVLSNILT